MSFFKFYFFQAQIPVILKGLGTKDYNIAFLYDDIAARDYYIFIALDSGKDDLSREVQI